MPYQEPITDPAGNFQANFRVNADVPDGAAQVQLLLTASEEGWTEDGIKGVFQDLIDLLDASPLVDFLSASRSQTMNTMITVTPPDESPGESA